MKTRIIEDDKRIMHTIYNTLKNTFRKGAIAGENTLMKGMKP